MRDTMRKGWNVAGQLAWNLGLLAVGSALCAVAVNGILLPSGFVSGGFTGLALVLHYLCPRLSVALLYALLNAPLFALGWLFVSRRFFLYSIAGTILYTLTVQWVHVSLPVDDPFLSALLGGIFMGVGAGIILRSQGSAGGGDILSVILFKQFSVRLGTTILSFNAAVISLSVALFPLEIVLYTLVYMYVTSQIVNVVVFGLSQRKAIFIVSRQAEAILRQILSQIHRGVTVLRGEGGYTGEDQRVLYTVVTLQELPVLKQIVRREDPQAFVVVSDTTEVMGRRIGNQPHW